MDRVDNVQGGRGPRSRELPTKMNPSLSMGPEGLATPVVKRSSWVTIASTLNELCERCSLKQHGVGREEKQSSCFSNTWNSFNSLCLSEIFICNMLCLSYCV